MPTAKELREKRANIWSQMTEIFDAANAEGRAMTAEERQKYDRAEEELDQLGDQVALTEAHEARKAEMEKVDRSVLPNRTEERRREEDNVSDEEREQWGAAGTRQYQRAFSRWMSRGFARMDTEDRDVLEKGYQLAAGEGRAAGVGTQAAGGYTVPPAFRARIVERMKQITAVRDVAMVINTETGATLPWPTVDDTANVGAILAENTQVTEQDVTFGQAQLGAYVYTSKLIRVSYQLLQDTFFDLEGWLARTLALRIGRIQNQHFTTGTGTSQPLGLVTGGVVGVTGAVGNTTSIPYTSMVDVLDTLDPAYLGSPNLQWMFSQSVRKQVRKLVDAQNRPLWEPSLQVGTPDSLLGYGIKLNNDMPAPAANAKSIAFGDFEEGYVIRDVADFLLLRLEERYADFLQVGFVGFQRTDATVQNTAAYTLYQNSAT